MRNVKRYLLMAILIFISFIVAYHYFFYYILKKQYLIDDVKVNKSTSYFLHSAAITAIWINTARIELGFQYDNILIKPIILLRDYYFKKGQEEQLRNSADDVLWWTILYPRMYGFYGIDKETNNFYIRNLSNRQNNELRLLLKDNLIRLSNQKILYLKSDAISDYWDILLNGYDISLKSNKYLINGKPKTFNHYLLNEDTLKELQKIYSTSKILVNNKKIKLNNLGNVYNHYRLVNQILYAKLLQNNYINCNDLQIKKFFNYYLKLSEILLSNNQVINNQTNIILESSFSNNQNQIPIYLLNRLVRCNLYSKDISKIKEKIYNVGERYGK